MDSSVQIILSNIFSRKCLSINVLQKSRTSQFVAQPGSYHVPIQPQPVHVVAQQQYIPAQNANTEEDIAGGYEVADSVTVSHTLHAPVREREQERTSQFVAQPGSYHVPIQPQPVHVVAQQQYIPDQNANTEEDIVGGYEVADSVTVSHTLHAPVREGEREGASQFVARPGSCRVPVQPQPVHVVAQQRVMKRRKCFVVAFSCPIVVICALFWVLVPATVEATTLIALNFLGFFVAIILLKYEILAAFKRH
ncbi:hypothetical protein ABEB36_014654 [Hypothenemus hampei]|uniref:Uncharacterized protein n=1 Tax=Hypothenemus hampei TaxID=57062 RepID=A0ABD1E2F8_HYPHA